MKWPELCWFTHVLIFVLKQKYKFKKGLCLFQLSYIHHIKNGFLHPSQDVHPNHNHFKPLPKRQPSEWVVQSQCFRRNVTYWPLHCFKPPVYPRMWTNAVHFISQWDIQVSKNSQSVRLKFWKIYEKCYTGHLEYFHFVKECIQVIHRLFYLNVSLSVSRASTLCLKILSRSGFCHQQRSPQHRETTLR